MKDLLIYVVSEIIGSSDFQVDEMGLDDKITLQVKTDPSLVGLIIGKEGKTIKNIRKILAIRATIENKVVNVSIV